MSKFKLKTLFKIHLFITLIFAAMVQASSYAQLPDQAEDISPLLYGEKIPEGVLTTPAGENHNVSGTILFEYINPDYSTRISAGLLLAVLRELKNKGENE